jgi:uncharacterized protein
MDNAVSLQCTAFEGYRRIASGALARVAAKTKSVIDRGEKAPVLIFDDSTSELIEMDFRGSVDDVLRRLAPAIADSRSHESPISPAGDAPRGPGRPRLGVVAREVTLLPRHWEWLNEQSGGASVALRKLVEEAKRANEPKDRIGKSREVTYKFMSAMAGNLPGFEEAARALFAGNRANFEKQTENWPKDIRGHLKRLTLDAFGQETL